MEDLKTSGYPFKTEWFAPHMEFRFPLMGEVTYDGVRMELRTALEVRLGVAMAALGAPFFLALLLSARRPLG